MLRGGGTGSGFAGFDFSHEGVKRVVGLLEGFVHTIGSAPREFLYLSYLEINEYMNYKKYKKKPPISLILYAPWYFFHDSSTSKYNVFYSNIQVPRHEPTNPNPDLSLQDQP